MRSLMRSLFSWVDGRAVLQMRMLAAITLCVSAGVAVGVMSGAFARDGVPTAESGVTAASSDAAQPVPSASEPVPSASEPVPSASPILDSSVEGLSEEAAVEIALAVAPPGRDVEVVKSGPLLEVFESAPAFDWSRDLADDHLVWYIYLVDREAGLGTILVLDFVDGTIYFNRNLR